MPNETATLAFEYAAVREAAVCLPVACWCENPSSHAVAAGILAPRRSRQNRFPHARFGHSCFVILSSFQLRHSSFAAWRGPFSVPRP